MKNQLRIQVTSGMATLLLSAWLLSGAAWAKTAPRTSPIIPSKNGTSLTLAGLIPSPASLNSCVGSGFSTNVNVTGTGPFTYQWYRNQPDTDEPVSGKTSSSLSLYPLVLSDAGSYYLQVTGPGGVVWSEAFVLTVNPAMIAGTPTLGASTICQGSSTTVSATFGGSATQGYFSDSFYGSFTNYVTSGNTVTAKYTPSSNYSGKLPITFSAYNPTIQCGATSAADSLTVKATSSGYSFFSIDTNPICQGGSTGINVSFSGNASSALFSDEGAGGTFSDVSVSYGNAIATYTPAATRTNSVSFKFTTPVPTDAGECAAPAYDYSGLSIAQAPTASALTLGATTVCATGSVSVSATYGGSASSGSFSDGGAGGSFDVTTTNKVVSGTYTPAASFSGEVTITFSTNDPDGPCQAVTSTATLTVSKAATASAILISRGTPICQGGNTYMYASFGGSASSGSFSDGGAGGAFSDVSTNNEKLVTANYTPASGFSGEVTLTFTTNDPEGLCPAATSTATLTVNPLPTITTPTLGASTICAGGSTTVSVTIGGGASFLNYDDPDGGYFNNAVYPSGNNKTFTATFTPNGDFSGEITLTFRTDDPNGPCGRVSSSVKLTVTPAATASTPTLGTKALCQGNSTTVSATFGGSATGGSFTDGAAGGAFSNVTTTDKTVSATYTPASNYTGRTFITFSTSGPCAAVTAASEALEVTPLATLTTQLAFAGSGVFCKGGSTTVQGTFGGGATGGDFSDGGVGGTFTNILLVGQGLKTKQALYTPPSTFTGSVTITFLTNDPDGDGPCPAVSKTLSLTVNPAATATTPTLGASTICQGSTTTVSATYGGSASSGSFSDGTVGGSFTNVSTNGKTVSATYTPASSYSGSVTITFTTDDPDGNGSCVVATSTASLTVNPAATASAVTLGTSTICQGGSTTVSASFGGSASSGSFSDGGAGGSFSVTTSSRVVSGTYTPAASYAGTITITFTTNDPDGTEPCVTASSMGSLTVNPLATATVPMLGAATICQGSNTSVSASFGGGASSGSFSDGNGGGTFSVTTTNGVVSGTYTPPSTYSGPITITFTTNDPDGSGPCVVANSTAPSLTINPAATTSTPTLGASGICQGNSTTVNASFGGSASSGSFGDGNVGGTFSVTTLNGVVSGTYTPPSTYFGPVTLTLTTNDPDGSGPCAAATSTVNLTVNALPIVSLSALAASYCQNLHAATPGTPAGGSYVIDGGSPVATFDPASLAAGLRSVLYTFTTTAGCNASATKSVEIIPLLFTQQPSLTGAPLCAGRTISLIFNANDCLKAGNTFVAYLSDVAGSLAAPVLLGSVTPGESTTLTIPAGTLTGNGYRIKIGSVNTPSLTSDFTSAFSVTGLAANFNSTATVSLAAACAGATIKVSFTQQNSPVCSFPLGNAFSAELSDASGNFTSPVSLGLISPGISNVTVPQNTPSGSGYRVRIAATTSGSSAYSTPSAAFIVNQPSFSSTPTVSLDNKCAGEAVRLSFSVASCAFPAGNSFTAQLSNATGSFAAPVNVGTVTPGGLNNVVIPSGTPAGTGYKLRVVSSSPEAMSAVSGNFKVKVCGNTREVAPEESGLQVSVRPNPSPEGRVRIAVSGAEGQSLRVELFNGTGQSVRQASVPRAGQEEVLDWDVSRQPTGLYLLRVSGEKESKTLKVLH